MTSYLDNIFFLSLKKGFRFDLNSTKQNYHAIGSSLFYCVALIGLCMNYFLGAYDLKYAVDICIAYCFIKATIHRLFPNFIPLWVAILHIPIGLITVIFVTISIPPDYVIFTFYLFPIIFTFVFHFHTIWFSIIALISSFSMASLLLELRQVPNWEVFIVLTLGLTLTLAYVVSRMVNKILILANNDPLTGLMNRRYWEIMVDYLIISNKRSNKPLCFIFIDLDGFKLINDTKGHAEGDLVLKKVADTLKKVCRDADCLSRWGGDEFLLALPNTEYSQAITLTKRIQKYFGEIKASCGVVEYKLEESLDELIVRADTAMYLEKANKST